MIYNPNEILAEALKLEKTLRDIRRDFHMYPELGFEEFRTTEKIKEILSGLPGIEIKDIDCPTGVIAELRGTKTDTKTIGLRCDIDALPITEDNHHGYESQIPRKMHACGHDGHITVNLGAAMLLSKFRPENNVRFIFQPAEETKVSGALDFLKIGVLDGLDEIWGFHLNATSDFGNVGWYDGSVMSGSFGFKLKMTGKSGHYAYPEACINPIEPLSLFVSEMHSINNSIHATRPFCFAFSSFECGNEFGSATPHDGFVTCRCNYLDATLEELLKKRIENIAEHVSGLYGVKWEIEYRPGLPVSYNHPQLGGRVRDNAMLFGFSTEQINPSMGGDDFGYYAQKIPAYYMTFGLRKGKDFPIAHTPRFDFDEAIIPKASALFASLALS